MRILHVNKFLHRRGGAEGYMFDVAAMQRGHGHAVDFWGMDHVDNDDLPYADTFAPQLDFDDHDGSLGHALRLAARMTWSRSARDGMDRVLDRVRPDVVHLHNVYHQLSPSILGPAVRRGIPIVMTVHDYKLVCPSYQLLANGRPCTACLDGKFRHAVEKRCKDGSLATSAMLAMESRIHHSLGAWDPVGRFICPSGFLRDMLARGGFAPDRLVHVPHFLVPGLATKQEPGGPLLAAGRLSFEKGFDVVVRALARLPDHVRLDIAGDGPERQTLEALAADLAPGRITFHGRVAKDQLLTMMRGSTALVVASRWYENQPMIILEANTCGLPVVATDLGGLTELVEEPETGWLVRHDDVPALADAMADAIADPDAAFERGRRGLRRSLAVFGPAVHLRRLDEVYADVGVNVTAAAPGGPRHG